MKIKKKNECTLNPQANLGLANADLYTEVSIPVLDEPIASFEIEPALHFSRKREKNPARQAWEVYPQVTPVIKKLSQYPPVVDSADYNALKKFVITMYDKNSTMGKVNEARLDLFPRKQRPYDG
ncbi:hypothetical protein Pmani_023447 [Petrolisthes manimaculis]|uniref:Uncharacterized protein n=1 Tax=Petrolisthes manimaculis TaxID=1843537 RepID=A0AAE1PCA9_9EUCA|nr:hypothetical protein Pmani_023447 [Petrolisthes manimaculis]